jgi:hypothetical protein
MASFACIKSWRLNPGRTFGRRVAVATKETTTARAQVVQRRAKETGDSVVHHGTSETVVRPVQDPFPGPETGPRAVCGRTTGLSGPVADLPGPSARYFRLKFKLKFKFLESQQIVHEGVEHEGACRRVHKALPVVSNLASFAAQVIHGSRPQHRVRRDQTGVLALPAQAQLVETGPGVDLARLRKPANRKQHVRRALLGGRIRVAGQNCNHSNQLLLLLALLVLDQRCVLAIAVDPYALTAAGKQERGERTRSVRECSTAGSRDRVCVCAHPITTAQESKSEKCLSSRPSSASKSAATSFSSAVSLRLCWVDPRTDRGGGSGTSAQK